MWYRAVRSEFGQRLFSVRCCTQPWEEFVDPNDAPEEHGWFASVEDAYAWAETVGQEIPEELHEPTNNNNEVDNFKKSSSRMFREISEGHVLLNKRSSPLRPKRL